MNIFITGATGFLGANFVEKLLKDHHHIYVLVRSQQRFESLLQKLTLEERTKVHPIYGELTKENLGIDSAILQQLKGQIDVFYHTAATLSFDEADREDSFAMNVEGTKNVLKLAEYVKAKKFIQVSTAYTLGTRTMGNEDLYPIDSTFVNSYEESKCHAEHLALSYRDVFDVIIMRPAIIIGDSETGEADTTFGLYGILRVVEILKKLSVRNKSNEKKIYRLLIDHDTVTNLVPVDYVTKVLALGLQYGEKNTIYNITNSTPPTNSLILEAIKEGMDFHSVELVPYSEKDTLTEEEVKYNQPLEVFKNYLSRSITFDDQNTRELLNRACEQPLMMDKEMLVRIIRGYCNRHLMN